MYGRLNTTESIRRKQNSGFNTADSTRQTQYDQLDKSDSKQRIQNFVRQTPMIYTRALKLPTSLLLSAAAVALATPCTGPLRVFAAPSSASASAPASAPARGHALIPNKPLMRHDVILKLSAKPDKIEQLAAKQAASGNIAQAMATLDAAIKNSGPIKSQTINGNNSAQSVYYLFEKAQLHYAMENTEAAEKEFIEAWKTGKLSNNTLMHAAWTLHHMGLTSPVLDITSQIIASKTAPEVAAAYFTRARTYVILGEDAKALQDYEASCKLNANDAPAQFELGRLYFYKGQNDKAIETLTQALTKFRERKEQLNCINTLTFRAKAYKKSNRSAEAIKDYSEAIALSPLQRDLLVERAAVYKSTGEKAKAAADEQKAKALDKGLDF